MIGTDLSKRTEEFLDKFMSGESTALIKSKQRVAENGEVFTPRNIVKDMLDLEGVNEESYKLDSNFLEPACGNGNFIIQILARKLMVVDVSNIDVDVARAIMSIYGVDIDFENITETRDRMMKEIELFYEDSQVELFDSMKKSFRYILNRNIILGNTLESSHDKEEVHFSPQEKRKKRALINLLDHRDDTDMIISDWSITPDGMVSRKEIYMKSMVDGHNEEYINQYNDIRLSELYTVEDLSINLAASVI